MAATSSQYMSGSAVTAQRHKILSHAEYREERVVEQRLARHREMNKPHRKLQSSSAEHVEATTSGSEREATATSHHQVIQVGKLRIVFVTRV